MNISKNTVPSLAYTLKNDDGDVLDQADKENAFVYLQGHAGVIVGLEKALEGKAAGDSLTLAISPEEAYGERLESSIQEMPLDMFGNIDKSEIFEGAQFHAETNQGMQIVTIIQVGEETITIDGNHPMAGLTLHFDIEVLDVRAATEEEIAHGHIHAHGNSCGHDH